MNQTFNPNSRPPHLIKADLIESARRLCPPSRAASGDYDRCRDVVAAELTCRLLARPDIASQIGPGNDERMLSNSINLVKFMGTLFQRFDPVFLTETGTWSFLTYRLYGFQDTFWAVSLETTIDILRAHLPAESFAAVHPCFDWLIMAQPGFAVLIYTDWPGAPSAPAIPVRPERADASDRSVPLYI